MNVIKFDLQDLEKDESGFTYYLQGRSYDLEENGVKKAFEIIKKCADKRHIATIYDLGTNFYYMVMG